MNTVHCRSCSLAPPREECFPLPSARHSWGGQASKSLPALIFVDACRLIKGRVDTPAVAQFVLGQNWRASNALTRQAFLSAFEMVLTLRLLPLLEQYAGERLVMDSARDRPGDRIFILVSSRILGRQGSTVNVGWQLARCSERYQIVDVLAEGVSITITARAGAESSHGASGASNAVDWKRT